MRGSQGLKPADAAGNAPPLQHNTLQGWQGLSERKAGDKQLLSFPQREVFRPAPQPAVGAVQKGSQRYSTLAANDTARPRRRGRYNWDGRHASQTAGEPERPSLSRRVLLPTGAVALLAGVALGAFYLMHTFATGPDAVIATAAATAKAGTAKAGTTVAAVALVPAARADASKASPTAASDAAGQVAAPVVPVKMAAVAPAGVAATGAKAPAPDNARWGEAADAKAEASPQAEVADAAPKVNDPQTAPVPTEAPKMALSKEDAAGSEAPKAETAKKLAYAAPAQAARSVDKAVTAALPSKDTALPGVDPNPLSVPAKASAGGADDGPGGYMSTVSTAVRLHASASNGSRTIGVVPKKATVHVLSCKGWCKVSYQGKEGYVYKSFLGHAAAPEKAAAASATETQQNTAKPAAAASAANAAALRAAAERTLAQRQ
ncbi:MAG: SH3 domain-containing protein [Hyphomicrobiales bacterium]|nr:SH3 domain-containing protein [Hyphomicrobiales bacterium]